MIKSIETKKYQNQKSIETKKVFSSVGDEDIDIVTDTVKFP